jgi:hypothetical protein
MSDTKKPIARIALHPVSAAIWKNHGNLGDGFYSVTFERRYRDSSGKWQSSTSFSSNELLVLAKVADLAHSEIFRLRANERQAETVDA